MGMTMSAGQIIKAARDVAGAYLVELGTKCEKVVVVTADVANSSRIIGFREKFADRTFNTGIAEQNAVSMAAGLAHEGFIPFVFSFSPFLSMRACEQIRSDVCYGNLPVRFIGSNGGYSAGVMGATHCGLEDVGITACMANMCVVEVGDPFQVVKVLEASMNWPGPIYIRLGREAKQALYPEGTPYEIGKAIIANEGDDGAIIAAGVTVYHALNAAKKIKEECGADIRVVDMHTIKPLDKAAVLAAAKTGRIVIAHDHNIIGGLGSHVSMVLAEAGICCKVKILGAPNQFVPIATADYLYRLNEYDAEGIEKNMRSLL